MNEVPDMPVLRRLSLALVVVALAVAGWRELWFITDDAFIAFRYVSNAMQGRGLVWNPAPFVAVEGYTSFLWVATLWGTWRFAGIEPPDAANFLSLLCGLATLVLGYRLLLRLVLPPPLARLRGVLLGVVLLSVVTQRLFLTWLSSGPRLAIPGRGRLPARRR